MNSRSISDYVFVVAALVLFLQPSNGWAQHNTEPVMNVVVTDLLETHWKPNRENRAKSTRVFQAHASHRRALLAFVLNRMQHNRNKEALAAAESLNKQFPDDIDGWVLRTWLDAVTNNYERALVDLGRLKKAARQFKSAPDAKSERMVLRRMGRMIGYMQGPVGDTINQESLTESISDVTKDLPADQLNIFNAERERVLTSYEGYTVQHTAQEQVETEKATVALETKRNTLLVENQQLEQQAQQLAPQIEQVFNDGAQKIERLRDQLSPLERDIASINNQMDTVAFDLQAAYAEIFRLRDVIAHHPHGGGAHRRLADLEFYAGNREFDLGALRSQRIGVVRQINALNTNIVRVQNDYDQRIQLLENERKLIARTQRRNSNQLRKLAKGPVVVSAKLGALDNRRISLTTYDPFPVELYKQYLLEKLIQ